MDRTKWPAITGLVVGTFFITRHLRTSFAADKPSLSCILLLACAAFAVIGVTRFLPGTDGRAGEGQQYHALPLEEVGQPHGSRQPSPSPEDVRYPSSLRKLRIHFLILVGAICVRVEILHQTLRNVQCTVLTWEPLIPFVFTCWDYWRVQRHRRWAQYDDPNGNVYDALEQYLIRKPYKYLIAAGLVSFGSILAIATTRSPSSTYICAATLAYHWILPLIQRIGTICDIVIAYLITELLHTLEGRGGRSLSLRFISVGWAFLFSAAFLLFCGTVNYIAFSTVNDRKRMLEIPNLYAWSLVKLVFWGCVTGICALLAILRVGLTTVSLISTFVAICTLTTSDAGSTTLAFPPVQNGLGFVAICLVILGFATYFQIETTEARTHSSGPTLFKRVPSWFYICLLVVFFIRTGLWAWSSSHVNYHPIDLLIYDAQAAHEAYVNQSSTSRNLDEAVKQYAARYGGYPPPGFQHWYKYATDRNSAIIDDFDGIYHDLLPFFALSPQEIRERTWQMISNPWHDASALQIRNGKVEIGSHVPDTHRWMLEGVQHIINPFAEWLPDMDLAFNVNDECRVAVPWEDIDPMRKAGREWGLGLNDELQNSFSENRAEQWKPVPDPPAEPKKEGRMTEMSWQRVFSQFGSVGCPPHSPARTERDWERGRLCMNCVEQQSMGTFLANWTTAADICHQPDIANLHGFYLSPAAFKSVHELYPIFSQSKVNGFNDILYPSAWNYMDKVKYGPSDEHPDPAFEEKKNALFWRGATSEGVSSGKSQWKGMTRQRFHHLANYVNGTSTSQTILIPRNLSAYDKKLSYETVPIADLARLISTDVHFVDKIARCGGGDCPQQETELAPFAPNVDFQTHWQYKHLLDLDGAGFSGRFLPFLHSHSLPFKAGLFREWWDGRVTAWQHFVPLDIRGQGFWATLAYFAGLQGKVNARDVMLEPHEMQGQRIAESGREWAGKVLRKEDMEIYMFRLLLEWGRLTDERREGIGFKGGSDGDEMGK